MTNSGSKTLTIAALLVGVVTLTIGFAVFSQSLTINSSAKISADETTSFAEKIYFEHKTNPGQTTVEGEILPVGSPTTAGTAKIVNNRTTLDELQANFTKPGQSVIYRVNVVNDSAYTAYLKKVNLISPTSAANCTVITDGVAPADQATKTLVDEACKNINLKVTVGTETFTTTTSPTNHSLAAGTKEEVVVTISYTGTAVADGPFSVKFNAVTLDYSTAK